MQAGTILSRELTNWNVLCKVDPSLLDQIVLLKVFGNGTGAVFATSSGDVYKIGGFYLEKDTIISPIKLGELCGKKIIKFDSGQCHLVALTKGGQVFACGRNYHGQLCTGDTADRLEDFASGKTPEGEKVVDVVCSSSTTLMLTRSGKVFTWLHSYKQINSGGRNRFKEFVSLMCIQFPEGVTISSLSCGSDHTAALSKNGKVYVWGSNYHSRLGVKSHIPIVLQPKLVPGLNAVSKIACGAWFTAVLTSGGKVRIWGTFWAHFTSRNSVVTSSLQIKELQRIQNVIAINNSSELWAVTNTGVYASTYRAGSYRRKRVFKLCDDLADAFYNSPTPCFRVQAEPGLIENKFQGPSNLVIVAGSSVIPVHRKVLRKRCRHFWKFFRRHLKNNCFTMSAYSPKVIESFINFLYTNKLDALPPKYLIELFILAKSYRQEELKTAVTNSYSNCLKVENVVHLYEDIHLSSANELLPSTLRYITRYFPHVLSTDAFKSLDDKLAKELVIKVAESPEIHNYSYSFFKMY